MGRDRGRMMHRRHPMHREGADRQRRSLSIMLFLDWLSEDDQGRSGQRVRLPRPRSVGLQQGRHARLLATGRANRQRIHRSFQRPLPGGVPECPLVPDACGRARKVGGLAQILQRGAPTWRDRPQGTDLVDQSRWCHQSAIVRQPENCTFRRSKEWYRINPTRPCTLSRSTKPVAGQIACRSLFGVCALGGCQPCFSA